MKSIETSSKQAKWEDMVFRKNHYFIEIFRFPIGKPQTCMCVKFLSNEITVREDEVYAPTSKKILIEGLRESGQLWE